MRQSKGRGVHLTAEQARGGRIVLDTPFRRAVFIGGLVGLVALLIAVAILAR